MSKFSKIQKIRYYNFKNICQFIIVASFGFFHGGANSGTIDKSEAFSVIRSDSTLIYRGVITPSGAEAIKRFFEDGGKDLVVTSTGGDVEAGLIIARLLRKYHGNVIVVDYCLSACANYLFLGSEHKSLTYGALLGFHGGMFSKAEATGVPAGDGSKNIQLFQKMVSEHMAFYELIKLNPKFFIVSYDLTRHEAPVLTFTLRTINAVVHFDGEKEASEALSKCMQDAKLECKLSVTSQNTSEHKVYFPSQKSLEDYGASGIDFYYYPKNAGEMALLAKKISDDLEVFGDF